MTYSVYQHWDPLQVCVLGRSYPPEFYSWIEIPHVRNLFERIAQETEEDYQAIIKKLQEFNVKVLRPLLTEQPLINGKFKPPPMTPRDYTVMIGDRFYFNQDTFNFATFYKNVKDPDWPECNNIDEFNCLPVHIQQECKEIHKLGLHQRLAEEEYGDILKHIESQGNTLIKNFDTLVNGAMVSRIGQDLYFGTDSYDQDIRDFQQKVNREFVNTRNHIVNTGGHSDATYCPVCPGLIISLIDVPTYADTFPDWEVVYLPGQSWNKVKDFLQLKQHNRGRWWIPGFEYDNSVIEVVEQWLSHWTGYVEETVFDVNMLIIDPKNVIVFNYNKQVFDALSRFGITPHVIPFRHRYFWDGGIHCVTSDLHRNGAPQNYFPNRT
jgi:hypothetical protein